MPERFVAQEALSVLVRLIERLRESSDFVHKKREAASLTAGQLSPGVRRRETMRLVRLGQKRCFQRPACIGLL